MRIDAKSNKKIIHFKNLSSSTFKDVKGKKVLVGGCFDIFHYGHLLFLNKAKDQGDLLIIALESDEFIRKQKSRDPVHNHRQRANILASFIFVDYIIMLPLLTSNRGYLRLVELIRPEIIAVSKGDPQLAEKRKQAREIGGGVKVVAPIFKPFSTKRILTILQKEL
ncbi:hypothetical protein A2866_02840 [Candidatus Roizmanbacteria bacterium RIFCSPHIGHO2_01_FULL_39_8]|uniref:Cytidyltransferase-like domain-containing protein n=3 Tax=Candidatus Roizmaniibacteriota TaxID=1752723 RepID=A0A1F7GQ43_9BACT|nr:MAG: hypothetical protein A2866_02840 [Candidatus Roizmanbacteria bacterium RIFCSPHIGHO2_01_FULL_39_8]OGK28559.1 MAG: hypothetical protein A3C28_05850 [Candidatus Roizmanbacteria bacterium RIFCSPHIGHO2_02_FULL_39_9]OGK37925.1 MAG: hypothetical protein A3F60_04975 [Candidatus Roizmanbacteria bacterium RIFCSPHIGHO2_12_FULL_39_8]